MQTLYRVGFLKNKAEFVTITITGMKGKEMKKKAIEEIFAKKPHMQMNLQFFAHGGDQNGDENSDDDNNDDEDGDEDNGDHNDDDKDEKKFTQADMSATAAREKKQGRRSAFKEMGFKSEKDAKEQMSAFRKWRESQMTPEQKTAAEIKQANDDKSDAEKRAEAAENKLAAIQAGVKKDAVDDAVAIAMMKVTEEKTLEDVLNEMKAQPRYKGFFDGLEDNNNDDEKGGTGSGTKHKSASKTDGIGKRLAQAQVNGSAAKSNFFRN